MRNLVFEPSTKPDVVARPKYPFPGAPAVALAAALAGQVVGCAESLEGPQPAVTRADPSLVCSEQLVTEVVVSGEHLSPLALDAAKDDPRLAIPDLALRRTHDLTGASAAGSFVALPNDPDAPDAARVRWRSDTEMAFDVYEELALEPGVYEIKATNRNGKEATFASALTVVPPPTLEAVEPNLTCLEQGMRSVTLRGQTFLSVGAELPTVTVGGVSFSVESLSDCADLAGPSDAQICTTAVVVLPENGVALGDQAVTITNPSPAGCMSEEPISVFIMSQPVIDAIAPSAICENAQPDSITVTGQSFLRVSDGAGGFIEPEVTVSGAAVAVTFDPASCTPLASATVAGQVCTSFTFPVPAGGYARGVYDLSVTNPAPAGCSATQAFGVAAAPSIDSVVPFAVCTTGDTFTVTGAGFVPGSQILVDGAAVTTTYESPTELTGTVESGFAAGLYDISVSNGASCVSNVLADSLNAVNAPVVYFVDPPNIYNGIDMRITVWASGIYGTAPAVGIRAAGTTDPLTMLGNPSYDGQNRVQADLPTGVAAAGSYDVVVVDSPCSAELGSALSATDTLTVSISSIEPLFGVAGERTGITIRSADPAPEGFERFEATPRAYLNPVGGGIATEVKAVSYIGAGQVDGVVPDTLPPGEYQLVLVNPDGDVGLLQSPTFRVLPADDPPPTVSELVPGLIADAPDQAVTIYGSAFPTDPANLSVTADCRDPRVAGSNQTVTATVGTPTLVSIPTTWNMDGLAGYVCVVRVSNLANNTFTDYSAVSVSNSSSNINPFLASLDMNEARRAAAGAAVRLNTQSRFLFAIGGDMGVDGTNPVVRHNSVESVRIDPFGDLSGGWEMQRNALPQSRSFTTAAVIDRHVYIAGGRVGDAPGTVDDGVYRAHLLDPFEAPLIRSLDLAPTETTGLDNGIWYYRVAAVMAPAAASTPEAPQNNNPGGEALPSEPLVIQLPVSENRLDLTLFWNGVPGAERYVIYRTPAPNGISGQEVFMTEIAHAGGPTDVQSFTDDGTIENSAQTRTPLPLGTLGVWHRIGTLATAREGAAVVAVPSPDPAAPDTWFLYALGGKDTNGQVVASYEWAVITASTPNTQTVGALQQDAATGLSAARWKHGAVYVDSTRATVFTPGNTWVYALPGHGGTTGEQTVGVIDAFQVDAATGALTNRTQVNSSNTGWAGYAYVAGNNYIHTIGAQTGGVSNSGQKAQITGEPTLGNWNAGTNLFMARYLHATARESAFIFLLGGQTAGAPASRSTERTNF